MATAGHFLQYTICVVSPSKRQAFSKFFIKSCTCKFLLVAFHARHLISSLTSKPLCSTLLLTIPYFLNNGCCDVLHVMIVNSPLALVWMLMVVTACDELDTCRAFLELHVCHACQLSFRLHVQCSGFQSLLIC